MTHSVVALFTVNKSALSNPNTVAVVTVQYECDKNNKIIFNTTYPSALNDVSKAMMST